MQNKKPEPATNNSEPRSGWQIALEIVGWLIVTLSGTCGGFFLVVAAFNFYDLLTVLLISGLPMAFGSLLIYLSRRK
ncbi:MAG: hypothetical protein CO186_03655 [Zetaproteobacteria bacterium CG_4_9_14_3_um_filter_49_83]|nr:MAG: hypothetical protein AUJ56_02005 [Zetaproteobacteria bacterium CG1_02_49_23]PIQ29932.1 MAG: hypothetical protein COW62_14235 [Zetaproteobacteria bacterium CG17_big_fil_post_rev_8_21_14_2_50_50_13]PIV29851.1 MAG: hypothetical protein COS35_09830 [Zetaproteobacteria bacterium CG02_land_8_20_14_3_00_50_9]PIY56906.1 MAG: hypothetical protein COZ00_01860 [Zetaproteobacteria bacterium CG_4_10_14_0_8_um_filter_49_80]PJA35837.1 MAG: hypothetical protein CO186_03655 [Zetaproteobacteria bacterium